MIDVVVMLLENQLHYCSEQLNWLRVSCRLTGLFQPN